jgi:hypothetical protein
MWDDFLRESLGRVDIVISEEDTCSSTSSSNPGAPVIVGGVLEDETYCALFCAESESDDDGNDGSSIANACRSGRQRPRADASADELVVT